MTATLVAALLLAPVVPVHGAQETDRLRQGWSRLAGGDVEGAARVAAALLARAGTDGGAIDARRLEEARLLQAACLYTEGRTGAAVTAIEPIADPVAVAAQVEDAVLPPGFGLWIAAVVMGNAPEDAQPHISLAELNPDREILEVASHFSMDVEIVRIPVIVEDVDGNFVTGLEPASFMVEDGSPPARPVHNLIREDEPTSIGLILDASDAARGDVPVMMQATLQLIRRFRPEDEVFVLQFGGEPRFLTNFAPGGEHLLPAVAGYRAAGARTVRDALATALIRMRDAAHDKKSLVLIASGDDHGSRVGSTEVRRAAQREGVSIHVLLLPAGLPRWRPGQETTRPTFLLQRLAHETGGLVALRPHLEERFGGLSGWIDRATEDIGSYIKHQYLLQFESVNPPAPGTWRTLRVMVNHAGEHIERIRARSGYIR